MTKIMTKKPKSKSMSHQQRTYLLLICLTFLFIGFQNCGRDNALESDSENPSTPTASPSPTPAKIKKIYTGIQHNCSLDDAGQVKCWGLNDSGQLGQGHITDIGTSSDHITDLDDINLDSKHKSVSLALGDKYSCSLLDNDHVKCWGLNNKGQLGYNNTEDLGDEPNEMGSHLAIVGGTNFKVRSIASGYSHTCVIMKKSGQTNAGPVKCWGENNYGQLGQGNTNNIKTPSDHENIDLGHDSIALATGHKHTCALLDNDCVKCWGGNDFGQLGYEDLDSRGDASNEMGSNLDPVGGQEFKVKAIVAGHSHTCVIRKNFGSVTDVEGKVQCWGNNNKGQLGQGNIDTLGDDADEITDLQFVDLGSNRKAKSIFAGENHTCARLDNDHLKCWGENKFGQLGQGSTNDIGNEANEMGDELMSVPIAASRTLASVPSDQVDHTISVGGHNTCFILDDFKARCWGDNFSGQLGQNHACSLGNGKGYFAEGADAQAQCDPPSNTPEDKVVGHTVDKINPIDL